MKGLSYPVYSVGAINSLLFGVYVKTLETLDSTSRPSYSAILVAGAVSGAAQLSLAVPVDLVKVRLQASKGDTASHLNKICLYPFQADRVLSSVYRASTLRPG